jgi:hypothetical protein
VPRRRSLLRARRAPAASHLGAPPRAAGRRPPRDRATPHCLPALHLPLLHARAGHAPPLATVEYRGGVGRGGDCAVCFGEFSDWELVRLLPRCTHPFHAPCIDTWLRAHVNCSICRSPVVVAPTDLPAAALEPEGMSRNTKSAKCLTECRCQNWNCSRPKALRTPTSLHTVKARAQKLLQMTVEGRRPAQFGARRPWIHRCSLCLCLKLTTLTHSVIPNCQVSMK